MRKILVWVMGVAAIVGLSGIGLYAVKAETVSSTISLTIDNLSEYEEYYKLENISGVACGGGEGDIWYINIRISESLELELMDEVFEAFKIQYPEVWEQFMAKDENQFLCIYGREYIESSDQLQNYQGCIDLAENIEGFDCSEYDNLDTLNVMMFYCDGYQYPILIESKDIVDAYKQLYPEVWQTFLGGWKDDNPCSLHRKEESEYGEGLEYTEETEVIEESQNYEEETVLQPDTDIQDETLVEENPDYKPYSDIFRCLNVLNEEKDADGNLTSATFYCNESKTLTVEGDRIKDFYNDFYWNYGLRTENFENDTTWFSDAYKQIANGKLLLLETDSEGYYNYFAIGGETEDGESYLISGQYNADDPSYHGYQEYFFFLGHYIVENPEGWQEKLEWFNTESQNWLKNGNEYLLSLRPEAYDKWLESIGDTEALFDEGLLPFRDTPKDAWYLEFVDYLKHIGAITGDKDKDGISTGYFRPNDSVTVAEFIKMALNVAGSGEKLGSASAIYWDNEEVNALSSDGYDTHWGIKFYKIIKYLKTRLVGEPDFRLDRPIKRKEVVGFMKDILSETLVELEGNESTKCFNDLNSNDKYSEDICYFKSIDLVEGSEDGTFKGENEINRAEAAKMAYQISMYSGEPILFGSSMIETCNTCEDTILLAEFLKKLIDTKGIEINSEGNPVFGNVEQSNQYYDYLATAYNAGFITEDVTIYDSINRSLAAKMIVGFLNLEGGESITLTFQDVVEDSWYAEYIKILIANGIIENGGEVFYPSDLLTVKDADDWISKL